MKTFRDDLVDHAANVLDLLGDGLDLDLSLDESGACYFEHVEGWRLAIMLTGEDQLVAAVSVLSGIETPSAERLSTILTELNWMGAHTDGAALSWNPQSQSFVLWRSLQVEALTAEDLNAVLLRLIGTASDIQPLLQAQIVVAASQRAAEASPSLRQRV